MPSIKTIFSLLLVVLLFSSCGMLKRAGIDKRRYRPGFYINNQSLPKLPSVFKITSFDRNRKIVSSSAQSRPVAENNNLVTISAPLAVDPTRAKKTTEKTLSRAMQRLSKVQTKAAPTITADENITATTTYFPDFHSNAGNGNYGEALLLTVIWIVIAVILVNNIPGITIDGAGLLACLIMLAVILIILGIDKLSRS
jgi:hypothetical protein